MARQTIYDIAPSSKMYGNPKRSVKDTKRSVYTILKCILLGEISGKNIHQNKMLYQKKYTRKHKKIHANFSLIASYCRNWKI